MQQYVKDYNNATGAPTWIRRQALNRIMWISDHGKVGQKAKVFYDGTDDWIITKIQTVEIDGETFRYVVAER